MRLHINKQLTKLLLKKLLFILYPFLLLIICSFIILFVFCSVPIQISFTFKSTSPTFPPLFLDFKIMKNEKKLIGVSIEK